MSDAILIIATGNYRKLARGLIQSIDSYLADGDVELFVFSDLPEFTSARFPCHVSAIRHAPWPFVTLNRFATLLTQEARLQRFRRLLYMDCDLELVDRLSLDELLTEGKIAAVEHPAKHLIGPHFWDAETNPESTAGLPESVRSTYYQGCLWGGDTGRILEMMRTLRDNTEADTRRGITAKWHDESHLNHYLYHHPELASPIPACFAYPENWDLPFPRRMIHKDKSLAEYPRFAANNNN
jgi:hypothetical protein